MSEIEYTVSLPMLLKPPSLIWLLKSMVSYEFLSLRPRLHLHCARMRQFAEIAPGEKEAFMMFLLKWYLKGKSLALFLRGRVGGITRCLTRFTIMRCCDIPDKFAM